MGQLPPCWRLHNFKASGIALGLLLNYNDLGSLKLQKSGSVPSRARCDSGKEKKGEKKETELQYRVTIDWMVESGNKEDEHWYGSLTLSYVRLLLQMKKRGFLE